MFKPKKPPIWAPVAQWLWNHHLYNGIKTINQARYHLSLLCLPKNSRPVIRNLPTFWKFAVDCWDMFDGQADTQYESWNADDIKMLPSLIQNIFSGLDIKKGKLISWYKKNIHTVQDMLSIIKDKTNTLDNIVVFGLENHKNIGYVTFSDNIIKLAEELLNGKKSSTILTFPIALLVYLVSRFFINSNS